jgi:molecular chaperone DnaJ
MATAERDYYEILGVERGASDADIKKAFRRLARELHPDVNDAPDAQERFREVAEAYEVLSDEERRQTYDRFGHAGLRGGGYQPSGFDFGNLSDLFSAFFGESVFGGGQPAGGARAARGGDVAASAQITLAEALTGTTVRVTLRVAETCDRCDGEGAEPGTSAVTCPTCRGAGRVQQVSQTMLGQFVRSGTCPTCGGEGRVLETPCTSCEGAGRRLADREREVDVPAGIHDGQRIRLRGEGHAGALGGPNGDAFVQVRVTPMPGVERDGDDLHTAVELTMFEAALGRTVTVPTPEGDLDLDLPGGLQPGVVHRVRGHGMPSLQSGRRGDLNVHVAVRVPTRLTEEQREQLVRFEEELGDDAYRPDDGRDDDGGLFGRIRNAFR